jgi:hypothetical protein
VCAIRRLEDALLKAACVRCKKRLVRAGGSGLCALEEAACVRCRKRLVCAGGSGLCALEEAACVRCRKRLVCVRVRVSLARAQMCVFVCVILQITGFLQGLAGLGTSSLCV